MVSENEIKKFERHLGKPMQVTIADEVFEFRPLSAEDLPDLLRVLQVFTSKVKPGQEDRWMEAMDEETTARLVGLVKKMVKKSYPELTDSVVDEFVSANFITLTTVLFQLNDLGAAKVDTKVLERIEKMKK